MPQLVLDLTDALYERLDRLAAAQKKSVQEVVLDQLAEPPDSPEDDLKERYEKFIEESGLFVKVPEEVKRRYKPVPEERLRELAAEAGKAGPLSEVIIAERKRI